LLIEVEILDQRVGNIIPSWKNPSGEIGTGPWENCGAILKRVPGVKESEKPGGKKYLPPTKYSNAF